MTFVLGLTGSIAMGKSTVARQFAALGAHIVDTDALVHLILEEDAPAIAAISQRFPSVIEEGSINRQKLGEIVFSDDEQLQWLEGLLHPKVRLANQAQIEKAKANEVPLLVLEIPLLYESGSEGLCDAVAVVTCDPQTQRARALAREGMTEERFAQILSQQLPDAQKRERADFVIDTSHGLEASQAQVELLISKL